MAVASADDVAVTLGRSLTSAEEEQVEWWLTGLELVLTNRLGDLTALDQAALAFVEVEVIAQKVRRAGTLESSITVSVDDGSVTRRYDNPVADGDITAEWWALLGYRPTKARSMRLGSGWRA